MKRQWEPEELTEQWTLLPTDHGPPRQQDWSDTPWVCRPPPFFHHEGRFPQHRHEIARAVVAHIAEQAGVPYEEYMQYDWSARSIKYHRAQIRDAFGFREATVRRRYRTHHLAVPARPPGRATVRGGYRGCIRASTHTQDRTTYA